MSEFLHAAIPLVAYVLSALVVGLSFYAVFIVVVWFGVIPPSYRRRTDDRDPTSDS